METAKVYASKPEDKKEKRKLWMKIAKYLFETKSYSGPKSITRPKKYSIQQAMELILKDSKVLQIDDLLPLFPPDGKV